MNGYVFAGLVILKAYEQQMPWPAETDGIYDWETECQEFGCWDCAARHELEDWQT